MEKQWFGAFTLDSTVLALPVALIGEVVSSARIWPMPSRCEAVTGCLNLRGTVIPVLDLRRCLNIPPHEDVPTSVVIMKSSDKLIGILIHDVAGVHAASIDPLSIDASRDHAEWISGTFLLAGTEQPISVLSAQAVLNIPLLPYATAHTAQAGQAAHAAQDATGLSEQNRMLLLAGGLPFSLPSKAVHAVVLTVAIDDAPLGADYCLGTMPYREQNIPALSLSRFLGLGRSAPAASHQAFVLRLEQGYVGFVVDQILDVTPLAPFDLVSLASARFKRAMYIEGALPVSAIPAESAARRASACDHYIMLNADTLLHSTELQGLSRLNTPIDRRAGDSTADSNTSAYGKPHRIESGTQVPLLMYDLGGQIATDLKQIFEVLRWDKQTALVDAETDQIGLVISRGQAISTYSLCHLLGLPEPAQSDTASILVVNGGHCRIGFRVPKLLDIEMGLSTAPSVASAGDLDAPYHGPPMLDTKTMIIGTAPAQRMVSLLDLCQIAAHCANTSNAAEVSAVLQASLHSRTRAAA